MSEEAVTRRKNLLLALGCGIFVMSMVGAAFAAVPLYQIFCRVTGYAGTTQVAVKAPAKVLDRTFKVSFDANIDRGLPLTFAPEQRSVEVKVGEAKTIYYRISNTSSKPITVVAGYNVAPGEMGPYFSKIQCFCFDAQTLAPKQTVELPVVFFIDPAITEDRNYDSLREVTLSYTYYPSRKPSAAAAPASSRTPASVPL